MAHYQHRRLVPLHRLLGDVAKCDLKRQPVTPTPEVESKREKASRMAEVFHKVHSSHARSAFDIFR